MSHRVIDEVLSFILPDPDDPEELRHAVAILNESEAPPNVLSCLRFKILSEMAKLNAVSPLVEPQDVVDERHIIELLSTRREQVEEIMVHVFDFIYFYGADPARYVPAIWRSWDAIPSLHRRFPSYILRTLCAVFARFWTSPSVTQDAVDAVLAGLESIARLDSDSAFIKDAIEYLKRNQETLQIQMWRRRVFVGVVRTFLQSTEILQAVRGQSSKEVPGHPGRNHKRKSGVFDGTPIENPIRFLEVNTTSDWSVPKSFWMLARLAFDTEDPAPLRIKGIHP
jgi:hypothetical protein